MSTTNRNEKMAIVRVGREDETKHKCKGSQDDCEERRERQHRCFKNEEEQKGKEQASDVN